MTNNAIKRYKSILEKNSEEGGDTTEDSREEKKTNTLIARDLEEKVTGAPLENLYGQEEKQRGTNLYSILGISGSKYYRKLTKLVSPSALPKGVLGMDTPTDSYVDGTINKELIATMVHEPIHGDDRENPYGTRTEGEVEEETYRRMAEYEAA